MLFNRFLSVSSKRSRIFPRTELKKILISNFMSSKEKKTVLKTFSDYFIDFVLRSFLIHADELGATAVLALQRAALSYTSLKFLNYNLYSLYCGFTWAFKYCFRLCEWADKFRMKNIFSAWVFICLLRSVFSENDFWHISQVRSVFLILVLYWKDIGDWLIDLSCVSLLYRFRLICLLKTFEQT